jgi:arginyl-tRNA--protein-N-Asp/Glu arginylyltransferase
MPKVSNPTEAYSNRRMDCRVIAITFDQEAAELIDRFCPRGRKTTGKFLGRLVYEHAVRLEERQRLQQALQAVWGEESTEM